MVTASPATATGESVADDVPAGALGIPGMPLMPDIPGVPPAEPKVIDGCASCRDAEHPASNSALTASTAKCFRGMVIMPRDR
jgi:hypothetical protein